MSGQYRFEAEQGGRRREGARHEGPGALARALERWRRALPAERAASGEGRGLPASVSELARRLDDSGCAYGRVSAARLEHLTRAYERLETKLNAVLMAATGTFLSTLAGLLLYYVRGAGH
ncbi:MAG: hypothetical protein IT305_08090 [Chloroflexi bacterium]|nr:hypothetical protein [Chloroflexota bacterium]